MAPKVSVLIPTYNYAAYLPEAIESVLSQSYTDFELLI
ncbi:MAG: glycosyltransferase family 2 protein, partial [Syntrophobacteraceae bacterium]